MARIAILSAVNIKHMSLISLYTEILKKNGVKYDFIYMDKYNEDEAFECDKKYRYINVIKQGYPKFIKKIKYMLFYPYATHILNKNKYDFVIVWNDLAIFMIGGYLSKHYAGKYCLNVRDNMMYDVPKYRKMYERVFKNSAFNTISSKGYLEVLPRDSTYLQINSLNLSVLEGMQIRDRLRSKDEPIRIGFIGYVRYYERNKKLLDVFKNDPRFELHYYGKNANVLKEYATDNDIRNTVFHDTFPVSDTGVFMEKIDIINNLYGNDTFNVRKAISIKFFHALYAKIPILVNSNTYVGKLAVSSGGGFYFDDISEQNKERLFSWYHSIDFQAYKSKADEFLNNAKNENMMFERVVEEYIIKKQIHSC